MRDFLPHRRLVRTTASHGGAHGPQTKNMSGAAEFVGRLGSAPPPAAFLHAEGGQRQATGLSGQNEIDSYDAVLPAATDNVSVLNEDVHVGGEIFNFQEADLTGLMDDDGLLLDGPVQGEQILRAGDGLSLRQSKEVQGEVGVGERSVDF